MKQLALVLLLMMVLLNTLVWRSTQGSKRPAGEACTLIHKQTADVHPLLIPTVARS